jgi:hypothetical protein
VGSQMPLIFSGIFIYHTPSHTLNFSEHHVSLLNLEIQSFKYGKTHSSFMSVKIATKNIHAFQLKKSLYICLQINEQDEYKISCY